jgi:hypothetical protein
MPVTATEKFESRRLTAGDDATLELVYTVAGTDDESEAKIATLAASPERYGSPQNLPYLFRRSVQVEPEGPGLWVATVRYDRQWQVLIHGGGVTRVAGPGDRFEFDTSGGTQHITQSLATPGRYGQAPDNQGAIGVSQTAVEGTDIVVPVFNFSETHHFLDISWSQRREIAELTGKVNQSAFRGFSPGEVLFLGASGGRRNSFDDTPWSVTFRFAASPNRSNFAVGPINVSSKKGWEYMWIRYAPSDDAESGTRIKRPVGVYIERVYEEANFSGLKI